jgi:F-type H+-transporting ATPase subunit delta
MRELVAKKYVNALMKTISNEEVDFFVNELTKLSIALDNCDFVNIISSPDVTRDKKLELILSICSNDNSKLTNLLKLLAEKNRFLVIPDICSALEQENALLKNEYLGTIFSNTELSSDEVSSLESQFSKKFDSTIKLDQKVSNNEGIKVEISGLGVEIGFSREKIQAQLLNHILKAI